MILWRLQKETGWPDPSSWHFFAFSYHRAFDALWDAAYSRCPLPIDFYPLLFVGRQSIELWLKAAITAVTHAEPPRGHKLAALWSELVKACKHERRSGWVAGAYPEFVDSAIRIFHSHDEKGDRFRYPTATGGDSYPSTEVDLDELYRAHELITGFCDAVVTQLKVERDFDASYL